MQWRRAIHFSVLGGHYPHCFESLNPPEVGHPRGHPAFDDIIAVQFLHRLDGLAYRKLSNRKNVSPFTLQPPLLICSTLSSGM